MPKKIKLDMSKHPLNAYPSHFAFANASKTENGLILKSSWLTCRETLINRFFSELPADHDLNNHKLVIASVIGRIPYKIDGKHRIVDTEAATKSAAKAKRTSIINITNFLNIIEKEAGWAKSKVLEIKEDEQLLSKGATVLVIDCNPKWLTSTQMISLLGLIARLSVKGKLTGIGKWTCLDDVHTAISNLQAKGIRPDSYGDLGQFLRTYPIWFTAMKSYKNILSGHENAHENAGHHDKGIDRLYCGVTQPRIALKWKAMLEKVKKNKEVNTATKTI